MGNQWCNAARRWVLALALAGLGLAGGAARADVITFNGLLASFFVGPETEGNFTYNTLSGQLATSGPGIGNPPPDMEAANNGGGGVLRIVRNGGGLFTFDGADVAQFNIGVTAVRFRGVLGGAFQYLVDLNTTAINDDFAGGSQGSGKSGVSIDELLVELDDPPATDGRVSVEEVDNIRLTLVDDGRVPEPATLALLGFGLAAIGWSRRRRT